MLLSMQRVQIIGTKRCQDKTVSLMHRLGVVQVDAWTENRSRLQQRLVLADQTLRLRERLAYALTRVESLLTVLPPLSLPPSPDYESCSTWPAERLLDAVEAELTEVDPQARTLTRRHDHLEEQLASLARYEATLRHLLPVIPALVDLEQYAVTAIWLERRFEPLLDVIRQQLETLTEGLCEVIAREVNQDTIAAVLVFPKGQVKVVDDLLGRENITQLRLPDELAGQPIEQALTKIRQRLQEIPAELKEIVQQQQKLARTWRPQLLARQAVLRDNLDEIDVRTAFGQTDYTFVIEGWIPAPRFKDLQAALAKDVGDEVLVISLPVTAEETKTAPIFFDNPRLVKPFEPLVGLLSLPRYGDFDPTPLMALFFPLFFGMILGDVAYGTILLVVMIYLRRRFKTRLMLRSLAEALILGAIWSIIFGFLFGEFLGNLGEMIHLRPIWFDRGHNIQALFILTIGLGAGHIILGLGLGVWSALRRRNKHQLMEKGAMLAALILLFLLVGIMTDYLPDSFFTPTVALLTVAVVVLIYSLGKLGLLLGPLEVLETVGNVLSYLRIAAIGLSSVYLAQVANELGGITGNILLGLIIATLFHALNLVLGTFSPTIQSLRLHYVEFFGKFHEGGGQPFQPFQRTLDRRQF